MIQTWIDNSHINLGLLDAAGKARREYGENERNLMGDASLQKYKMTVATYRFLIRTLSEKRYNLEFD